jgi:hypothetical protein
MENFSISTAELLVVLSAMETAANAYGAEANRTTLSDIRRTLKRRADRTRAIAGSLKNRAVRDNTEFARAYRAESA